MGQRILIQMTRREMSVWLQNHKKIKLQDRFLTPGIYVVLRATTNFYSSFRGWSGSVNAFINTTHIFAHPGMFISFKL